MRIVDGAPVRPDHKAVFCDFRGDLPKTPPQSLPLASPRPTRDCVLGTAPVRFYRPPGHIMGDRLPFALGRPHYRPFDREELVGQSGFVCQIQFARQGVLVRPEARKVHDANADQHNYRCAQCKTVKAPPETNDPVRSSFTHGSRPLQKDSLLPGPS